MKTPYFSFLRTKNKKYFLIIKLVFCSEKQKTILKNSSDSLFSKQIFNIYIYIYIQKLREIFLRIGSKHTINNLFYFQHRQEQWQSHQHNGKTAKN